MRDPDDPRIERDFGRRSRLQPARGQRFSRHDPLAILRRKRRGQQAVLAERHAIAECRQIGGVDRDGRRIASGNDIGDRLPLVGLFFGIPGGLEQSAKAVAADGQPFDRLSFARIVKDQDRTAPGMHALRIEHGRDDRFLEIFARHEHPHGDALFAHDRGNDRLEPLRQHRIDDFGAFAHRQ